MSRTHKPLKFILSSILMLHSLTALAQGDMDGSDLGADPGLPAEAPASPQSAPRSPAEPGLTLPGPDANDGIPPPSTPPTPRAAPKAAPAAKAKPAIGGKLGELNLSAEQTQQILDIRRQWKPEAEKRLKEEFMFFKQNLAQAMADNSSGEEVRRRFELMQKKYLELQTMKFDKLLRIREVLTPEQRKKFAELRSRPGRNNDND